MLTTWHRVASTARVRSIACGFFIAAFATISFAHDEGIATNISSETGLLCMTADGASSTLFEYTRDPSEPNKIRIRNKSPYDSIKILCFPKFHRITNLSNSGPPDVEGSIDGTIGFVAAPFTAIFRFRHWASGALLLEKTLTLNGLAYEQLSADFASERLPYWGTYSSIEITIPPEGVVNNVTLTYR